MLSKTEADLLYLFGAHTRAKSRKLKALPVASSTDNSLGNSETKPTGDYTCAVDSNGNYAFERKR